jgi:2-oxoisovalerate dehydrogenase E2 component (dihydrolipoyl transacylase)
MPLIVKATSMALHRFPELNASVNADCTQLTVKAGHNIGVAMDTPNGLLVPNIKDVGNRSLLQVAQELARLQVDASAGKLAPADLKGGTFTLSNIGNLGGTYTGPVINLPEIAIAGLGKIRPTPRYDEAGSLVRRSVMQVSWAADHRVVDGAMMARFSNTWISILEKPASFLLME